MDGLTPISAIRTGRKVAGARAEGLSSTGLVAGTKEVTEVWRST